MGKRVATKTIEIDGMQVCIGLNQYIWRSEGYVPLLAKKLLRGNPYSKKRIYIAEGIVFDYPEIILGYNTEEMSGKIGKQYYFATILPKSPIEIEVASSIIENAERDYLRRIAKSG